MGAEARCRLEHDGASHEGKALLETDELIFRGDGRGTARGYRLAIPFASIRSVQGENGTLHVEFSDGSAIFRVGDQAERWAERIRSPKPLIDKLDVKIGQTISIVGVRDPEFLEAVRARAARVAVGRFASDSNLVFLGAENVAALARLEKAAVAITREGAIWVVHPKGADGLRDIEIFAEAKRLGLTYTKVARFSSTHTAEKLVIPKSKR